MMNCLILIKRIKKLTDNNISYTCELKYDGVSISLTYKEGVLFRALTRGDGIKGDDVTSNIRTIKSIPLKIQGSYPKLFEIRGEVFIPLDLFQKMNKERLNKDLDPYSNPRNTASGSLKLLDSKEVAKRPLDCFLYYVWEKIYHLIVTSIIYSLLKNGDLKCLMK